MSRAFLLIVVATFSSVTAFAQSSRPPIWKAVDEKQMLAAATNAASSAGEMRARRNIVPRRYHTIGLNRAALESVLASAPREFTSPLKTAGAELSVPLPDGGFGRFRVQKSPDGAGARREISPDQKHISRRASTTRPPRCGSI